MLALHYTPSHLSTPLPPISKLIYMATPTQGPTHLNEALTVCKRPVGSSSIIAKPRRITLTLFLLQTPLLLSSSWPKPSEIVLQSSTMPIIAIVTQAWLEYDTLQAPVAASHPRTPSNSGCIEDLDWRFDGEDLDCLLFLASQT